MAVAGTGWSQVTLVPSTTYPDQQPVLTGAIGDNYNSWVAPMVTSTGDLYLAFLEYLNPVYPNAWVGTPNPSSMFGLIEHHVLLHCPVGLDPRVVDNWNQYRFDGPNLVHTTTLSSPGITGTAAISTIDVADASAFLSAGTLIIDGEYFAYTGKSGNTFTGVTRGYVDTPMNLHATGATVKTGSDSHHVYHNPYIPSYGMTCLRNSVGSERDVIIRFPRGDKLTDDPNYGIRTGFAAGGPYSTWQERLAPPYTGSWSNRTASSTVPADFASTITDAPSSIKWPTGKVCISRVRRINNGNLLASGQAWPNAPTGAEGTATTLLLVYSQDDGLTWKLALPVTTTKPASISAWTGEWDFAELQNGNLLAILHAGDATNPSLQAYLATNHDNTYTLGAVTNTSWPNEGHPELLSLGQDKIIYVSTASSGFQITEDGGQNWQALQIDGQVRNAIYYPRSVLTSDGTVLVFSHNTGDIDFQAGDQTVVLQSFKVPIVVGNPAAISVGQAFETDAALPIGVVGGPAPAIGVLVGQALESDLALPIGFSQPGVVTPPTPSVASVGLATFSTGVYQPGVATSRARVIRPRSPTPPSDPSSPSPVP